MSNKYTGVLTAGSKTFILGEYAVLRGLPALILNSEPCSELHLQEYDSQTGYLKGIFPESPAGRFYQAHRKLFQDYSLTFQDPHYSQGGFGASSAQFVLLYQWYSLLIHPSFEYTQNVIEQQKRLLNSTTKNLLASYLKYAWQGIGYPPSGADVIGQYLGGFVYIDKIRQSFYRYGWPFPELAFILIRTGKKTATHKHLQELDAIEEQLFADSIETAHNALNNHNPLLFIEAIKTYQQALQQSSLTCDHTLLMLDELNHRTEVLAAKGCGALGADVILALCATSHVSKFILWLKQKQWVHWIAKPSFPSFHKT